MMYVAVFIYGGINYPMYSLAISHINDVLDRDQMIGARVSFHVPVWSGRHPRSDYYRVCDESHGSGWVLLDDWPLLPAVAAYALWRIVTSAAPAQSQFISLPARGCCGWLERGAEEVRQATALGRCWHRLRWRSVEQQPWSLRPTIAVPIPPHGHEYADVADQTPVEYAKRQGPDEFG